MAKCDVPFIHLGTHLATNNPIRCPILKQSGAIVYVSCDNAFHVSRLQRMTGSHLLLKILYSKRSLMRSRSFGDPDHSNWHLGPGQRPCKSMVSDAR